MTCPLVRSRTAVTVVVQGWPVRGCTRILAPTELGGERSGRADPGRPGPGRGWAVAGQLDVVIFPSGNGQDSPDVMAEIALDRDP